MVKVVPYHRLLQTVPSGRLDYHLISVNILTKERNRLNPENAEKLLFCMEKLTLPIVSFKF